MFTAEEAREKTNRAIEVLPDQYFNIYCSKAEKAIQEAIKLGKYEAKFNIRLAGSPFVDKMEEGFNRLINSLKYEYKYKVDVEEIKLRGMLRTYSEMWVTVSWADEAENGED